MNKFERFEAVLRARDDGFRDGERRGQAAHGVRPLAKAYGEENAELARRRLSRPFSAEQDYLALQRRTPTRRLTSCPTASPS